MISAAKSLHGELRRWMCPLQCWRQRWGKNPARTLRCTTRRTGSMHPAVVIWWCSVVPVPPKKLGWRVEISWNAKGGRPCVFSPSFPCDGWEGLRDLRVDVGHVHLPFHTCAFGVHLVVGWDEATSFAISLVPGFSPSAYDDFKPPGVLQNATQAPTASMGATATLCQPMEKKLHRENCHTNLGSSEWFEGKTLKHRVFLGYFFYRHCFLELVF